MLIRVVFINEYELLSSVPIFVLHSFTEWAGDPCQNGHLLPFAEYWTRIKKCVINSAYGGCIH